MTRLVAADFPIIRTITAVTGSISLVCSLFIIISYLIIKQYKRILRKRQNKPRDGKNQKSKAMATRLVVYLSISDVMASLFFVIGAGVDPNELNENPFCDIQGWGLQMFVFASILWTFCIAFNFYMAFIRNYRNAVNRFEKYYHVLCWGVPFITACGLLGGNAYANTLLWCWIGASFDTLRFLFFYIPLIIIMIFNFIIYVLVLLEIRKVLANVKGVIAENDRQQEEKYRKIKKLAFKFFLYTIAFFFTWIWGIINRIQNAIDPSYKIYELYVLHTFFTPFQGFMNAIAYGLTEQKLRVGYRIFYNKIKSKYTGVTVTEDFDLPARPKAVNLNETTDSNLL